MFRPWHTTDFISWGQFLPKNTADFSRFTSWPEPRLYIFRISISLSPPPPCDASEKTMLSSAKRRCNIQGECIPTLTPLDKCIGSTDFKRQESPSKHRRNKYGDIGSPCLTPLRQLNNLPSIPFNQTEELPVLRLLWIQPIHLSKNPLPLSIWRIT